MLSDNNPEQKKVVLKKKLRSIKFLDHLQKKRTRLNHLYSSVQIQRRKSIRDFTLNQDLLNTYKKLRHTESVIKIKPNQRLTDALKHERLEIIEWTKKLFDRRSRVVDVDNEGNSKYSGVLPIKINENMKTNIV
jgi:hypothetical protein